MRAIKIKFAMRQKENIGGKLRQLGGQIQRVEEK